MIIKETEHLLQKLNKLKAVDNKEGKQLKTLSLNMQDYEGRMKKYLAGLDDKITEAEEEYKTLKDHEKEEEDEAMKKIDQFEVSLKKLLNSYSNEAKQANKKLTNMYTTIKEEMKNSFRESIQNEKDSFQRLKIVSGKLEKMIDFVRNKQKSSIDQYEHLKELVRIKSTAIMESNQVYMEEYTRRNQQMVNRFCDLQDKINEKLQKMSQKCESKEFQTNKMIHFLIQNATNE